MQLSRLIEYLSDAAAYPKPVDQVEVRQTHISVVFLADQHVYKVKKPVNLGFLDFSTLDKRRQFCEEEVRLNRRLAPAVYEGVVPVVASKTGLRVEGAGEPVEWAVKMTRLPEQATYLSRLLREELDEDSIMALAKRIAAFHAEADGGDRIAGFGTFEIVLRNACENFEQSKALIGVTVSGPVFGRLQALSEEALARLAPLIEGRAKRGVPRDTHGDLHLDHVYLFPEQPPPDDLVIIDCIEFNERFRFADPVADMAFLVMDLIFHGRRDLASTFTEAYFQTSGDNEGRQLVPFYTAYRAVVRAKVEGLELSEKEIPQTARTEASERAQAHWLLALSELEEPRRRPCLVLIAGLPGTGKSTLARNLAARAGFQIVRSDQVRKELAGVAPRRPAAFCEDIYTAEWTERTYAEILRRAEELLSTGQRVIVDANFREEKRRQEFLKMATRRGMPAVILVCRAAADVARERLRNRQDDASDADWTTYQRLAAEWEELGPVSRRYASVINMAGSREDAVNQGIGILRNVALAE